jgi:hypothetical protein
MEPMVKRLLLIAVIGTFLVLVGASILATADMFLVGTVK